MDIKVTNHQKKIRLNQPLLKNLVTAILRREGITRAEISVNFVTHQKIRALNKQYLKRDHATDVLAFDLSGERSGVLAYLKGDIIISVDAARKQCRAFRTSFKEELALYVIHGMLHLLGYDDHRPSDIKRMRAKEQELLLKLKRYVPRVA